jgi:hypothetical protein
VSDVPAKTTAEYKPASAPKVGEWYWVDGEDRDEKAKRWLGCVTHVGTNYAELTSVGGGSARVHLDEFWKECTREEDAQAIIDAHVLKYQTKVRTLMGEVLEVTKRLAVDQASMLDATAEASNALVVLSGTENVKAYKKALVKAKEKELPDLFAQIKEANERAATWMKATLIPLKAQVDGMKSVVEVINGRIFNVELYAGLVEEVTQIAEGAPAPLLTPIHLFQRRHYMDEECLIAYETGGMEFANLRAFDKWIAKPKNRDRILPFPRTIVAFRVRRNMKKIPWTGDLAAFIRLFMEKDYDKSTFLYIRNGEQLFRLETKIEFDEKLFPDLDNHILKGGKLYASKRAGIDRDAALITEDDFLACIAAYEKRKAVHIEEVAAFKKLSKALQETSHEPWFHADDPRDRWEPFTPESVYYDDIAKVVQDALTAHNRIVMVLQGLLDRSPVLHPHPPWSLWTEQGFASALKLVYDDSRALVPGAEPDFERFRAFLNKSLKTGSITVGQEIAWERHEARKENDRRRRDWRDRSNVRYARYRPYGNPGPGTIARVARFMKSSQQCVYEWLRPRARESWRPDAKPALPQRLHVEAKYVVNVEAYTPGDYRVFFADPRTRADYLQWAPLLLECEEWHAGNRELGKSSGKRQDVYDGY